MHSSRPNSGISGFFLGLIMAQIIATIHVYRSNLDLYATLETLSAAGYLTVPNQHIAEGLKTIGPALGGGLFFTLTIGVGLSVVSFLLAHVWNYPLKRNKILLIALLPLWLAIVAALNWHGITLPPSSYFLFVPPIVFFTTIKLIPKELALKPWLIKTASGALVLVILAVIWSNQINAGIFIKIRDQLLLTNPVGKSINGFYYRYTLYPANAFKSLRQKTLKTADLSGVQDRNLNARLGNILIRVDYLPLASYPSAGVKIESSGGQLAFKSGEKTILEVTREAFQKDPWGVMAKFSTGTDRHKFFRRTVYYSLIRGLPITIYILVFILLRFTAGIFLEETPAALVAAVIFLAAGLALWAPISRGSPPALEAKDILRALASEKQSERVAALRFIQRNNMEIHQFPAYKKILASPHVPERYRLAQALGVSRRPETFQDLLALLDDPSFNVVYTAYSSLGRRKDRRAVAEILSRIKTIDDWYVQDYAYYALKNLGWRQPRSD